MALVKDLVVRFRQSASGDVAKNRFRVRPANTPAAYDAPFDDVVPPAPNTDGYTRVPLSDIPQAVGLEGRYDVHVTAVDSAGNESDFLEIDNQLFDLSPPLPPSDGSVE